MSTRYQLDSKECHAMQSDQPLQKIAASVDTDRQKIHTPSVKVSKNQDNVLGDIFHATTIEIVQKVTWFTKTDAESVWKIFEVFGVIDDGRDSILWPRVKSEPSDDLIALVPGPFQLPHAFIIADGRYGTKKQDGVWQYSRHLGVSKCAVLARVGALQSPGIIPELRVKRGPTFCAAMTSPRVWCDRTRNAIIRAAAAKQPTRSKLLPEAKVLCRTNTRWPPINRLVEMVAARVSNWRPRSKPCGVKKGHHVGAVDSPFHDTIPAWLDESNQIDACAFAEVCPGALARRQVTFDKGKVVFQRTEREFLPDIIATYLASIASTPEISALVASADIGNRDATIDYIGRMKPKPTKGILNARPPCIQRLLASPATPWNNVIRFQLAYTIRTVSQITGQNAEVLAEPFIDHMYDNEFGKHRIDHFKGHIRRRSSTAFDKVPCASRRHGGLECPFGGGGSAVQQCTTLRGTKDMDALTTTIAQMWTAMPSDETKTHTEEV